MAAYAQEEVLTHDSEGYTPLSIYFPPNEAARVNEFSTSKSELHNEHEANDKKCGMAAEVVRAHKTQPQDQQRPQKVLYPSVRLPLSKHYAGGWKRKTEDGNTIKQFKKLGGGGDSKLI